MTGSLVVEPEGEDAEPLDSLEGAGAASSVADFVKAAGGGDPLQIAFTGAGAGLDALGVIADPFDAFLSSAVGYLIEHLWFLHEPLDALAGDPKQIKAQAQTWHNVSRELSAVAAEYRAGAAAIPRWDGPAATAYREATGELTDRLERTAAEAEQLSVLVLGTGAAVGTVRALIRDMIAEFLATVAKYFFFALLLAPVTMAGSAAAAIGHAVWQGVELGIRIADRISTLLTTLSAAGGAAGRIADGMRAAALQTRAVGHVAAPAARSVTDAADARHAGKVIETGKQFTGAAQDRSGWEQPAPPG